MKTRSGMVLLIVFMVVVMLSLAGLTFVLNMQTENKAAHVQGRQLQLEHVVSSGAELVKAFCQQSWVDQQEAGGASDNAGLFRDVLVLDGAATGRQGRFSVVSPDTASSGTSGWRFGLDNESAKLNLGVLLRWEEREPGAAQRALLTLPGMTPAIADALLDWIDPDGEPRPQGAEAEYYQGRGLPYGPRNGVPQCLEELLLVREVTRELVFGTAADMPAWSGGDDGAGGLGRSPAGGSPAGSPWASLLTVCSAERNETATGQPRINVNRENLAELHEQLAAVLDRAAADFIVLYRQRGPHADRAAVSPASVTANAAVDVSLPARVRIESLLDLVDAQVRLDDGKDVGEDGGGITPDGADPAPAQLVASPWTSDPASLREALPKLLDLATVTDDPVLEGRININLAPRAVLQAVPGIDSGLADRILSARGVRGPREDTARRLPTWLWTEGLVERPQLQALWPYVTGGGDVVRAQIVGYDDLPGPTLRVELVIDAAQTPPRQIYWKDLRLLTPPGATP